MEEFFIGLNSVMTEISESITLSQAQARCEHRSYICERATGSSYKVQE